MPRPHPTTWLPILDHALSADVEIGISFRPSGIDRAEFRRTLLEAAKTDPKYKQLITFLPGGGHEDEIWVCKREVELGEGA